MLKWIILALIVAGCTYIGFGFGNYYKTRSKFFNNLILFLEFCDVQITFYQNKIAKIFEDFMSSSNCEKELKRFLTKINAQFNSNQGIKIDSIYLNDEEKKLLTNYFENLGTSNVEKQKELIEFNKVQFKQIAKNAESQSQKNSTLSLKLGFLLGLAVAICFI